MLIGVYFVILVVALWFIFWLMRTMFGKNEAKKDFNSVNQVYKELIKREETLQIDLV